MKDISYKVALGGIVSAMCLVCMFLAGVIPLLYLLLPMVAGILMMIIAEEVSISWAWLTYISVSILSLFITADKEAALIFIMLFGHFPVVRFYIDRIKFRAVGFLIKMLVCNACLVAYFYVTVYIFGIKEMLDDLSDFGKYGALILLILGNVIFVFYDVNLGYLHDVYIKKFMPKLKKRK